MLKRRRSERSSGTITIGVRAPALARLFDPSMPEEIRFPNLRPLPSGSAWSAVALVRPDAPSASAGIVCQRRQLAAGANAFSLWLKEGAIVVETGGLTVASKLIAPLRQWTFVGIASAADGMRVYRGLQDSVEIEDLAGLLTGPCMPETPLVIGRLGGSFPGAIASVCLFSEKLGDDTMRAICSGRVDPRFAPKLGFAWLASGTSDLDMVSRQAPMIVGTKLVPFNASMRAPTIAAAPSIPVAPSTPAAPAPPPKPPVTNVSTATGSSLFRELGLEPGSKEQK